MSAHRVNVSTAVRDQRLPEYSQHGALVFASLRRQKVRQWGHSAYTMYFWSQALHKQVSFSQKDGAAYIVRLIMITSHRNHDTHTSTQRVNKSFVEDSSGAERKPILSPYDLLGSSHVYINFVLLVLAARLSACSMRLSARATCCCASFLHCK